MATYVWAEGGYIDHDGSDHSELLIVLESTLDSWLPMMDVLDCNTWGEVKALGPKVYNEVLSISGYGEFADYIANFATTGQAPGIYPVPEAIAEWAAKQDEEAPTDDQYFEAYNNIPMVADGDWPPHIGLLMAENLPAEILDEFANWTYTSFNGDFASIPLHKKDEVLAMLERMGHAHRTDNRVSRLVYEP